MKAQTITAYGEPLQEIERPAPRAQGTEVVLDVSHCGVCHSDVHLHDGYFDLGGERHLDLSGAHRLPFTPGHEIAGTVAALGPDAGAAGEPLAPGERRVVYPWIGCGECAVCERGDEHLCARPRALGVNAHGGYAQQVLVPHPRYLLDHAGITPSLAGTYMCSGLTAFSALRKTALAPGATLAIVGLGGVGFMGLQFARALLPQVRIVALDIAPRKLELARAAGAAEVYDAGQPGVWKQVLKASGGGVQAALDFVGAAATLDLAQRLVAKGGKVVVVGLFGGTFSLPVPMFPLRELTVSGSYVGSLADARSMLELVRGGTVSAIPIETRPLHQAGQALEDLRAGRVIGRVVLECAH